jgi:hypothetical protein
VLGEYSEIELDSNSFGIDRQAGIAHQEEAKDANAMEHRRT